MTMRKLLFVAAIAVGLSAGGIAYAQDAAKLADTAGCMKCHDIEKKKMGAPFKSVAAKYKGKQDAEKTIVAKLKSGEGHQKANASDADLASIVKWVLAM
jgi:cytochrome c